MKENLIKHWRLKRKMTQAELVKKANFGGGQSRIHEYETGKRIPSTPTLKKLAKALKVNIEKLIQ